jgi:anthranilate synthase/aminodeoxychorismate synthase-like glutamine amidotransferase
MTQGKAAWTNGTRDNGVVTARILIVDNYDSFVFNLAQDLAQLGAEVDVRRTDEVATADARSYDGVLLSPGPGDPHDAGVCMDMVDACAGRVPLFGVCLGHQAIGAVFGGVVSRAPELLHGKTSMVHHTGTGVLAGLPDPFRATRYPSLAVERESVPAELEILLEQLLRGAAQPHVGSVRVEYVVAVQWLAVAATAAASSKNTFYYVSHIISSLLPFLIYPIGES